MTRVRYEPEDGRAADYFLLDHDEEIRIRCAALQAAATLVAGMVTGGIVSAASENRLVALEDMRQLCADVVADTARFALEFEKHLRGQS